MHKISELELVTLQSYTGNNGALVVLEGNGTPPFEIARVFIVTADAKSKRGRHAHKSCGQFLICTFGGITVACSDGINTKSFQLNSAKVGLFIPPGIWCEQEYLVPDSVLTVLCDRKYESGDYIHKYNEFIAYRSDLSPNRKEKID